MSASEPPEQLSRPQATVRVRLTVSYDGSGFRGFAPNPGVRTVAGVLTEAIGKVRRHEVTLSCAGRTDAGVHARGQVVSFDTPDAGLDLEALVRSLNRLCSPEVAVRDPAVVGEDFDARRSARWRRYRYTIHNHRIPDPLSVGRAWHVAEPLDLARLRLGCDPLIGEHDFTSFCRQAETGEGRPASLRRHVQSARWEVGEDHRLHFWVCASSFCHQMVRSMVGTLTAIGAGKLTPGELRGVLAARDRAAAGPVAPPHGLVLWDVGYQEAERPGEAGFPIC